MKYAIKPSRHEDVLYLLWQTTTALESWADSNANTVLDRALVTSGYDFLTEVGYIVNARPIWERRIEEQALKAESGRRTELFNYLKTRIDSAPKTPYRKRKAKV